jgi:hypothetical protein
MLGFRAFGDSDQRIEMMVGAAFVTVSRWTKNRVGDTAANAYSEFPGCRLG